MTNTQQIQQIISLRQAVTKMADEINNTSEDECSINGNIPVLGTTDSKHQNNHSVAAESKSSEVNRIEADSSLYREMTAYNSSNRLPDHQTRWNSR
jgi:hypothetical protein